MLALSATHLKGAADGCFDGPHPFTHPDLFVTGFFAAARQVFVWKKMARQAFGCDGAMMPKWED